MYSVENGGENTEKSSELSGTSEAIRSTQSPSIIFQPSPDASSSSEAVKAARRQQEHGEPFIQWMEAAYREYSHTMLQRTHRPAAVWERATGGIESDWVTAWCDASQEQLLEATDGNPDEFVQRVQSVVETWDDRVQQATPGEI